MLVRCTAFHEVQEDPVRGGLQVGDGDKKRLAGLGQLVDQGFAADDGLGIGAHRVPGRTECAHLAGHFRWHGGQPSTWITSTKILHVGVNDTMGALELIERVEISDRCFHGRLGQALGIDLDR